MCVLNAPVQVEQVPLYYAQVLLVLLLLLPWQLSALQFFFSGCTFQLMLLSALAFSPVQRGGAFGASLVGGTANQ